MVAISEKYGFSPRLLGLMMTAKTHQEDVRRRRHRMRDLLHHHPARNDPERGEVMNGNSAMKPVASAEVNDNIALYLQVKDTVNYFSTDQTQKGMSFPWQSSHLRVLLIVPEILTSSA